MEDSSDSSDDEMEAIKPVRNSLSGLGRLSHSGGGGTLKTLGMGGMTTGASTSMSEFLESEIMSSPEASPLSQGQPSIGENSAGSGGASLLGDSMEFKHFEMDARDALLDDGDTISSTMTRPGKVTNPTEAPKTPPVSTERAGEKGHDDSGIVSPSSIVSEESLEVEEFDDDF